MSKKNKNYNKILKNELKCLLYVLAVCSLTVLLSLYLDSVGIGGDYLLMVFIVGVMAATVLTRGYIYGIITSVISILSFNYFFTEPKNAFMIKGRQDIVVIVTFLAASLICGFMSAKLRKQSEIALKNEHSAQLMYEITEGFLNLTGIENIAQVCTKCIYSRTGCGCRVTLDRGKFSGETKTVFESENFVPGGSVLPIRGVASGIGTLELSCADDLISPEDNKLIKIIIYQTALMLDRELIFEEREKIKLSMESERQKTALLRSVSHDIRTPLTGILGAGTILRDDYGSLDRDTAHKLAGDICEECSWLISTVQNILDMTRISDGKLSLNTEYEAVDDLVNQAVSRIPAVAESGRLKVRLPEEIMLVKADGKLLVQVLVNLIDNAVKHSGEDSDITLSVYKMEGGIVFEVADNGSGIDESILPSIFEGFVTKPGNASDKGRGVGLGLFICKAIAQAHGGSITAGNRPEGGAVFRVLLPDSEGE